MNLANPLPWRKITSLHHKLGARSIRYPYPTGHTLPVAATPDALSFLYNPAQAIDRIVGFTFSAGYSTTSITLVLRELNTGWQFTYASGGYKGVFVQNNMETLPDEANISWYFSASSYDAPLYLSFMNIELIPFQLT